ncbi:MAG: response regulator [Firmicutes bacterium]|jgi:two-component system response regulator YesN|nr:response regulator [Bacillota bacterium]
MYRILIIDDEAIVLDSYSYIISNNFENVMVETAKNGKEGLVKLDSFKPHIVITDIRMPGISGLEFIKAAREIDDSVKIAIASAYEQFEYAKEALKYNIEDYLLKPLTKKKLLEYLENTILGLDKENKKRLIELENIEKYYKSIGLLESNFLYNIVIGRNVSRYIQEYKDIFSMDLSTGHFITIKFPNLKETIDWTTIDEHNNNITDTCEFIKTHIKYNYPSLISNLIHDKVYIYIEHDQMENSEDLYYFIEKAYEKISKKFNVKMRISIGSKKAFKDIYHSYEESMYNLSYGRKNIEIFKHRHSLKSDYDDFNSHMEKVHGYFINKNSKMSTYLKKAILLYEPLLQNHMEEVESSLMETMILIFNHCVKSKVITRDIYNSKSYLMEFNKLSSMGKITYFDENIRRLFKIYCEQKNIDYSDITIKGIEFIEDHRYEDISLEAASKTIGVSPQYLSKIFKQDTSKSFKEYHKEIRMNKAKSLLSEDNMTIKEISDYLGYMDYNYFIRTFKKHVGCTPTEYKG